jgi:hypothetical protein
MIVTAFLLNPIKPAPNMLYTVKKHAMCQLFIPIVKLFVMLKN